MAFCYQKNFSHPTLPVDEAQFWALVRAKQWNENIDRYRETGEASLKRKLPAFIFQATFDETESKAGKLGRWRKQAATRLTGLVVMDIDHVEKPRETWEGVVKKLSSEVVKPILLVYVTPSGHGLKIVFKADPAKGNLIDNQHAMAKVLGLEVDESCKDASRMSFICKEEDILFIDKELFTYENKEFAERYNSEYRNGNSRGTEKESRITNPAEPRVADSPCETKWRGYDIQGIIDARYADKLPCKDDSNRHAESLKLATDLLLMLDGDKALVRRIVEAQPWVQEIIEERDENVAQTVESAAQQMAKREERSSQPYPSKAMQAAIEQFTGSAYKQLLAPQPENEIKNGGNGSEMTKKLDGWGREIEALWGEFPMLKDVCTGLKRTQYPAALFVAGGLLMTLMTRCWYRFYHKPQKERRLNCSLFVIGHPASGKSMADDLYNVLAQPMMEADEAGKKALNDYKNSTKKKAANKEGKDKPKALIRIHPARTANGQFITDMINAREDVNGKQMQLHMFTFDTELDNVTNLQSGGSWINKQSMELKAFHNEEDGQMYMNLDSPVDNFNVTWNFIYTGTPIALKKKVNERNFGSGLSTRLAVLPMPKTNYEMLEYEDEENVDWERLERMKDWAHKLDTRAGQLPVQPIVRHLWEWTKAQMEDCAEDDSEANELMLKRVAYHGLNYAAPFIDMRHWDSLHQDGKYMTGNYEVDETDWRLCELIARIQYATQQHFFGKMAENYFDDMNNDVQNSSGNHQKKSVIGYNRLPDVFTKDDVTRCFGYDNEEGVKSKLRRLKAEGFVVKITKGSDKGKYRKKCQFFL